MKKQIEAFKQGYNACMQDLQCDIAESFVLEKIEWLCVDPEKRTLEYANKLKAKENGL